MGFVLNDMRSKAVGTVVWLALAGTVCSAGLVKDNELSWDGLTRTFNYYEPTNLAAAHPVVFVLHGGGVNADLASTWLNSVEWCDVAEEDGVLVVFPDGVQTGGLPTQLTWNDGRADNLTVSTADDVGFIGALLDWCVANYPALDTNRVYAVGASNGGMMALRLGQELSGRIAAVGLNVAFKPALDEAGDPSEPVSAVMIAGDADPQMPWSGGYVGGRTNAGTVLSAFETRDYLVGVNGCRTAVVECVFYPDTAPDDGPSTVESELYSGGRDGSCVMFCRIRNGGHIQPSDTYPLYPDPEQIGNENRDVSGVRLTWQFFKTKTLRPFFPGSDAAWETTSAHAAGADPDLLADAVLHAWQARSDALVILHGGRILEERYWRGASRTTRHELYSASKSMMSFLVGMLVADGTFDSLDQLASDFVPEWAGVPGKKAITLRHQLEMTTGIEGGERNLFLGTIAPSERDFAVGLPMDDTPGSCWTYNNPPYRLLFYMIDAAAGESVTNLFARKLAAPIGMSGADIAIRTEQVDGEPVNNYQYVRANALSAARFGLLSLYGGAWKGTQLVQRAFAREATEPSQPMNPSYGLLWWLNGGASGGGHQELFDGVLRAGPYYPSVPPDAAAALGYNDQVIAIVPSLDLVVVRVGGASLGDGSMAFSRGQNTLLGNIANAFGYAGQAQKVRAGIRRSTNGVQVSWTSWQGRMYEIEQSGDLVQGAWTDATTNVLTGNGLPLFFDIEAPSGTSFFRVAY